jgi:hypothetical protein
MATTPGLTYLATGINVEKICFYRSMMFRGTDVDKISFIMQVPVLLFLTVTGLIGNVLSFCALGKELKKSSTSVLLRALAVADNTVLVGFAFYFSFRGIYPYTGFLVEYFEFFQYIRIQIFALMMFFKQNAVYLIVLVSIERYIAVCKPLRAQSLCTVKNANKAIILLVIISFIYRIPSAFLMDVIFLLDPCSGLLKPLSVPSNFYKDDLVNLIYVTVLPAVIECVVPVVLLVFMNYKLITTLKSLGMGTDIGKRQRQTASLTQRVVAVSIIFIILETPGHTISIIFQLGEVFGLFNEVTSTILYVFIYNGYILSGLNSFINFYVYCLTGRGFRKALAKMFGFDNKKDPTLLATSTTGN